MYMYSSLNATKHSFVYISPSSVGSVLIRFPAQGLNVLDAKESKIRVVCSKEGEEKIMLLAQRLMIL
jgi:hypothetical protein